MRFLFDNSICSNPGSEIVIEYSPIVKDDGSIGLEESGKSNIQEFIDSFKESCDIKSILARFNAGEVEVLNRNLMRYGDFTEFPKSYAEFLQIQIDSNNLFNSLPNDIKEKFDFDCNKFFVMSGTKEWIDIIKPMYDNVNIDDNTEKVGD